MILDARVGFSRFLERNAVSTKGSLIPQACFSPESAEFSRREYLPRSG